MALARTHGKRPAGPGDDTNMLNDTRVRNAKRGDRPIKLSDGRASPVDPAERQQTVATGLQVWRKTEDAGHWRLSNGYVEARA